MSDTKLFSVQSDEIQPRHPCREVAALLAMAICRLRNGQSSQLYPKESTVRLDSSCHQSVHANPNQHEGVCQ